MSAEPDVPHEGAEVEEVESKYVPPPEKTLEEILAADQEDESLRKYKEALLGDSKTGAVVVGKVKLFIHWSR
jgi:Rho GDP-dissociation inhibitor